MRLGKTLIYVVLFLITCVQGIAQVFTASLSSKKVAAGERFTLTYTAYNKSIETLYIPELPNFSLVGGPNQGTSTQIINGASSMTSYVSYDLVCMKPGKYSIAAGTLKSKGKTYTSNLLEIEITKGGRQNSQQQRQQQMPDPFDPFGGQPRRKPEPEIKVTNKDLLIVTELSKSNVYPGEPITVTYTLYTRFPLVDIENIKFPEYRDAWFNELDKSGDTIYRKENYKGQTYYAATIKQGVFIPQKPGDSEIKAVTARVFVSFSQRSGNLWEDLFGGRTRQEKLDVTGNGIILKVKEYPEKDKPASFKDATGDFTMDVKTIGDSVSVNDAFTIKVTISGSGNLTLLSAPTLNLPESFEIFAPKSTEKITVLPGNATGSKTFEYTVIPSTTGDFHLQPVVFSFLNPNTGKYNTLTSDSIHVLVNGSAIDSSDGENDIRGIKTNFQSSISLNGFFPSILFFVIFGLLLLVTVSLWFLRARIWDIKNDGTRKKTKAADSVAVKRLKKAEEFLHKGEKQAFYEECYRAVIQYLQDRMGVQLSAISAEKVKTFLLEKGVSPELGNEVFEIISVCELARFAPPGNSSEMNDFHHRCIDFIANMEGK